MDESFEHIKKIVERREKPIEKGDRIGDWEYQGNTTQPGNPLWDEWKNVKTGESSLKTHTPQKISNFDTCDHYFVMVDGSNAQCNKCELGQKIVWGMQLIKDGKILDNRPPHLR